MDLAVIIPAYKSKQILSVQLPVLMQILDKWALETQVIIVVDGGDVSEYLEFETI